VHYSSYDPFPFSLGLEVHGTLFKPLLDQLENE